MVRNIIQPRHDTNFEFDHLNIFLHASTRSDSDGHDYGHHAGGEKNKGSLVILPGLK